MLIRLDPLLKYPDFRRLFIGQYISFIGSMITFVAVPYQIYEITKQSSLVGLVGSVQLIPLVGAALWGGALADRMDRRKLLIGSEILMVLAAVVLALNSHLENPSVLVIFLASAFLSGVNGLHRPALEALKPQLLPRSEIPSMAALDSFRYSTAAIAGPALGGWLIARYGLGFAYWLDVVSFALSLLALSLIRSMPVAKNQNENQFESIVSGLKYAKSRPDLIGTYLVDIIAMLFAMPIALFPAMAENWGGATAAGWLFAAMPMGSVVIAVFSGWAHKVRRHGAAVILSAALWGVAIIALAYAPNLWTAVFCLALAGASDAVSALFRSTIWNQTIPTELRGRLAGVEMLSYMTGPLLGNARAGFMASATSNFVSILSGGILCVVGTLLCIKLLPQFWNYLAPEKSLNQDS